MIRLRGHSSSTSTEFDSVAFLLFLTERKCLRAARLQSTDFEQMAVAPKLVCISTGMLLNNKSCKTKDTWSSSKH